MLRIACTKNMFAAFSGLSLTPFSRYWDCGEDDVINLRQVIEQTYLVLHGVLFVSKNEFSFHESR